MRSEANDGDLRFTFGIDYVVATATVYDGIVAAASMLKERLGTSMKVSKWWDQKERWQVEEN